MSVCVFRCLLPLELTDFHSLLSLTYLNSNLGRVKFSGQSHLNY